MTDLEFLEHMTDIRHLDHPDGETCGMCYTMICGAEAARELLARGRLPPEPLRVWADRQRELWRGSKFFKLWQEEVAAGREPPVAFEVRGWEP